MLVVDGIVHEVAQEYCRWKDADHAADRSALHVIGAKVANLLCWLRHCGSVHIAVVERAPQPAKSVRTEPASAAAVRGGGSPSCRGTTLLLLEVLFI